MLFQIPRVIGSADGPSAIYVATSVSPLLIAAVAVAAVAIAALVVVLVRKKRKDAKNRK